MYRRLISVFVFLALLCAATAYQLAAPSIPAVVKVESGKKPSHNNRFSDIDLHLIRRIQCLREDDTGSVGTAWFIRENTLVTAAHVVGGVSECDDVDSGTEAKVIYIDWDNDFAIIEMVVGPLPRYIEFKCSGFSVGQIYFGTGWAGGVSFRQTQLRARGEKTAPDSFSTNDLRMDGLRFLEGNLYSGMSGGPVFDDHGNAVGINSATDMETGLGFSRSLRDTVLCGSPRKNKPLKEKASATKPLPKGVRKR